MCPAGDVLGVADGELVGRQRLGLARGQHQEQDQEPHPERAEAAVEPGVGEHHRSFGRREERGGAAAARGGVAEAGERLRRQHPGVGAERDRHRRVGRGHLGGHGCGHQHLPGEHVGLRGERLLEGAGVGVDQRPLARGAQLLQGVHGATGLLEADHVDEDLGLLDRLGGLAESGAAGVGAVGEHQQLALPVVAGHREALLDAVVEPGLLGELESLDHVAGLVAVQARGEVLGHVAVEGDDADVDVLRDRVQEGVRGGLRGPEALAGHRVAGVHDQDRGPLHRGGGVGGGRGGLGLGAVDGDRHVVDVDGRVGRDVDQDLQAVVGALDVADAGLVGGGRGDGGAGDGQGGRRQRERRAGRASQPARDEDPGVDGHVGVLHLLEELGPQARWPAASPWPCRRRRSRRRGRR